MKKFKNLLSKNSSKDVSLTARGFRHADPSNTPRFDTKKVRSQGETLEMDRKYYQTDNEDNNHEDFFGTATTAKKNKKGSKSKGKMRFTNVNQQTVSKNRLSRASDEDFEFLEKLASHEQAELA